MTTPHGSAALFAGARLIIGDGSRVIENGGIVVRDGIIEQVGPLSDIPDDPARTVVPLTGRTVMPAVVNPHGHIGYFRGARADVAHYSYDNILDHLRRLAYHGVSVFQSLGTDRDDTELRVRDLQRAGRLGEDDVATLFTAGAGMIAATPGSTNGGPFFARDILYEAGSPQDAREHVRRLAAKRVDAVKFWLDTRKGTKAKLTPDIYRALISEAHEHGLKVAAHIYTLDEAKDVIRAGADIIAHMPRDPDLDAELIDLLTTHDVAAFTSMSIQRPDGEGWLDDPLVAETVSPAAVAEMRTLIRDHAPQPLFDTVEAYQRLERTLKGYVQAGVRIVFSADTGLFTQFPGLAEHRELAALAEAGMPAQAVIQSATQRSAELLGLADRGTLEVGKRADLLVLSANPLDDIGNTRRIDAVYLAGRPVDRAGLRAGFAAAPDLDRELDLDRERVAAC